MSQQPPLICILHLINAWSGAINPPTGHGCRSPAGRAYTHFPSCCRCCRVPARAGYPARVDFEVQCPLMLLQAKAAECKPQQVALNDDVELDYFDRLDLGRLRRSLHKVGGSPQADQAGCQRRSRACKCGLQRYASLCKGGAQQEEGAMRDRL